jgi:RNA polymerase sigma-70 factor, ECF subfamily
MVAVSNSSGTNRLLQRLRAGADVAAIRELFGRHRERLRKMVRLRLDWRLRGRISSASIVDQVLRDVSSQLADYATCSDQSFFLWLRQITGRRLDQIHRQHLGQLHDDAAAEIRLYRGSLPEVSAGSMAAQLMGDRAANQSAARAEMLQLLQGALNSLDPMDREILALRNFEEMSSDETAEILGMNKAAAIIRYVQAAKRLNEILASIPGFFNTSRS